MYWPIVGATNDVLAVEPDAPDELLVALEDAQASAAFDVPESDGVVAAATDYEAVAVLEAGDAPLVTRERAHELARWCVPNFDSSVTTGRHYVLLVEVHHVHRGAMAHQYSAQRYLRLRRHVPYGDRAIL